ncbi:hypothetical protein WKU26_12365 [Phocaeicola sp. HCN-40430]|uniref:hypothetical protein n=1 Tax=Phocaeicola sp. HCN-40430 TaxID=3134664 RepID=UPI0030BECE57
MKKFLLGFIDLIRILKGANFQAKKNFKNISNNKLIILGNGKSLNETSLPSKENTDYLVVNRHVLSDNYNIIKPLYYVLADPFFFNNNEGLNIITQINTKTSWNIFLYIPYNIKAYPKIKKIITNPHIKILTYNSFKYDGHKFIKYFLYNHYLAIPHPQNVLVPSIMIGIFNHYQTIELYGVEHTWTKYLYVDKNNIVYLDNPHFFDKEKNPPKSMKEIQKKSEYPFYLALKDYARMFESYWEIKDYIIYKKKKCKIINKTQESFIDAFEKK